jgi:hypothetical protein
MDSTEQADVAGKIIGSVVVDAHHTTENQLLAMASFCDAEFNRSALRDFVIFGRSVPMLCTQPDWIPYERLV